MGDCWFISLFLLIPKALFVIPLADRSSFFFTPQVIGAVIGAAWHMAREKVSTNWAKVPILGGLQCHQERGNVAMFKENLGRQKKCTVSGRSTILTSPFAYFQIN